MDETSHFVEDVGGRCQGLDSHPSANTPARVLQAVEEQHPTCNCRRLPADGTPAVAGEPGDVTRRDIILLDGVEGVDKVSNTLLAFLVNTGDHTTKEQGV